MSDPARKLDVSPEALWMVADADESGELSGAEVAAFAQIAEPNRQAPSFHKVTTRHVPRRCLYAAGAGAGAGAAGAGAAAVSTPSLQ